MSSVQILIGDCRDRLRELPEKSVHCCVTSPPYFGLRDYGHDGQIGLEDTPDAFVVQMVEVFREVWRVLRDDGTCWVNLGDSYNNFRSQMGPGQAVHGRDKLNGKPDVDSRRRGVSGLKEKDLIGVPWRVAFALQVDGWCLRQDIIWAKPNPMPESVRDRCTKSHEYLFLLTKQPRYYFDHEAIKEEASKGYAGSTFTEGKTGIHQEGRASKLPRAGAKGNAKTFRGGGVYTKGQSFDNDAEVERDSHGNAPNETGMRNRRSVWTVATAPFKEAHFATYPPKLIEPCILAGAPEKCCAACGAPHERQVERTAMVIDRSARTHDLGQTRSSGTMLEPAKSVTTGWAPTCTCDAGTKAGVVIDPFGGAGTTALVADRLGRDSILIELNPEYAEIAERRLNRYVGDLV